MRRVPGQALAALAAAVLAATGAGGPAAGHAQAPGRDPDAQAPAGGGRAAPADTLAFPPPPEPGFEVPEIAPGDTAPGDRRLSVAPDRPVHQYRLALGGGSFGWEDDAGLDDGGFVQLDVERDVLTVLAFRAGLAYGTTEIATATDVEGNPIDPVDARLFLPEISALLQADVGPFRDGPFVPYAALGFGSLVTDPDVEGRNARSQNAFGYGVGARVSLPGRLGARGELRRHLVKLEDPLGSTRESESVYTTRFGASLTYAF
ncbi:MAG TPA: outer membrane beta-barrel protein [Gemmatimonadota bacterium]